MFTENPFSRSETLRVVESRPSRSTRRMGIRAISIVRDLEDDGATAKPAGIDALLGSLREPEAVKLFHVDYDCSLTQLPDLGRFPNIEHVHLEGRKLRDYRALDAVPKLSDLSLFNYKEPDFSRFKGRPLARLRMVRGRIERLSVCADFVFLQQCTKLVEFDSSAVNTLLLESCNRVDLKTLGRIQGLTDLDLLAIKSIPSFSVLADCKSLKTLVVTANPFSKTDLSYLRTSRRPRRIFLGARNSLIADLADSNPHIIITNGDVCYVDGQLSPSITPFYEE